MSDLARGVLVGVVMEIGAARRLSERIRLTAHSARENLARLQVLVQEAQAGQAHVALGYASWTAYLADVFGEEPLRLPRDQRQELVGYLAGEGMSVRAISAVVDLPKSTVADTLNRGVRDRTPEPSETPAPDAQDEVHTSTAATDPTENAAPHREPVTGLDGKTYPRPEPRPAPTPPRATPRRALVDDARDAGQELRKVTERLQRLASDDRLMRNKDEVAAHLRHHLEQALQVCQDLSDLIT